MIYPHVIRLRGPWHFEVLPDTDRDAKALGGSEPATSRAVSLDPRPAGSAPLPHDWTTGVECGDAARICWRRRFSRPSNLDPGEAVWLCIAGRGATLAIALNGESLGTIAGTEAAREFDVTSRMKPRNELAIEVVELPDSPAPPPPRKAEANVRLEIRRAT